MRVNLWNKFSGNGKLYSSLKHVQDRLAVYKQRTISGIIFIYKARRQKPSPGIYNNIHSSSGKNYQTRKFGVNLKGSWNNTIRPVTFDLEMPSPGNEISTEVWNNNHVEVKNPNIDLPI